MKFKVLPLVGGFIKVYFEQAMHDSILIFLLVAGCIGVGPAKGWAFIW
jgi:hypothetical protein